MNRQRLLWISDIVATASALLVLPVIAIEMRATDPAWLRTAVVANWAIWLVFPFDAAANLFVVGPAWLRQRSAWLNVAIIVASFPVLPELMASTRMLRLARLGRLGRVAQSARLVRVLRMSRLLVIIPRAFVGLRRILDPAAFPFVAAAVGLVVIAGGVALYLSEGAIEGYSFADSLWWAVTTVTTVGYGDVVPHTPGGRVVAVFVMMVGIAFTSLLTAQVAAHLASHRQADANADIRADLETLAAKIDQLAEDLRRAGSGEGG